MSQIAILAARVEALEKSVIEHAGRLDHIEADQAKLEALHASTIAVVAENTSAMKAVADAVQDMRVDYSELVTKLAHTAAQDMRRGRRLARLAIALWIVSALAVGLAVALFIEHREAVAQWMLS